MRLHGGQVWVEDRRDGQPGARFVVELPVVPLPSADDVEALREVVTETPDSTMLPEESSVQ